MGAPSRSPLAGMTWRAVDIAATPGSSFKAVTGLAAIDAALNGDGNLREVLRGNKALKDAAADLKIVARTDKALEATPKRSRPCKFDEHPTDLNGLNALAIPNHLNNRFFCAGNAGEGQGVAFSRLFLTPKESGCRGPSTATSAKGGLCEALITSSNLFFGGLALYLDRAHVVRSFGDREEERPEALPDLAMARIARRLFPDEFPAPRRLAAARPDSEIAAAPASAPGFDLLRGQLDTNVPRLFASPMVISAATATEETIGRDRRIALGVAGYGQSVSASTLAMATVYAGIGSEHIVRPRIVPYDPSRPERVFDPDEGQSILKSVAPGQEKVRDELMTLLRRGLAGVISSTRGTAHPGPEHRAFEKSPLVREFGKEIIFAKTGTAKIGWACRSWRGARATKQCEAGTRETDVYSSWLAGWIEPSANSRRDRRVAFACNVSYTFRYGADACGPIIREILEKLQTRPGPP
jgi:cell division protein FtsI/penicillin-binding protein 2